MKTLVLTMFIIVTCILRPVYLSAQVKTKIYPGGLPERVISKKNYPYNEVLIDAPSNFEALKQTYDDAKSLREYKARFAEVINVDYLLLNTAREFRTAENVVYSMKLTAAKALNISVQFSEFQLSPNAILSIYTDFEFTDSITSKENNAGNRWASRIYQGNELYLTLTVPGNEISQVKLQINKVGFGFRQIGGEFFGNPGTSGNCNLNVVCPAGTGWENERNSVALIISGGNEICTGTLLMNTCGSNIPYLLTADHCLNSDVSNWVFQFQTWSNDCATNTGWREDVQFNGCQLRANNAATDFALVELNQIPAANSGINYSGWTRNPNPAITTTAIHHPMGDLMKVSHDFQSPVSVSWFNGANNHWRATFDQGIVQHGSSGSALYDENHRILGQLHGRQDNICNVGDNNCFCNIQTPSIGEYGRFDLSWTGGGTNATRLSNWLDPSNSGAISTNTTNISALFGYAITGPSEFCSSQNYSIPNFPSGATVTWSVSSSSIAYLTNASGSQVTVNKSNAGMFDLTATISFCGTNTAVTKSNITTGVPLYGNVFTSANQDLTLQSWAEGYNLIWEDSWVYWGLPGTSASQYSVAGGNTTWTSSDYFPNITFYMAAGSYVTFAVTVTEGGCAETLHYTFIAIQNPNSYGYYSLAPNPVSSDLIIYVDDEKLKSQKIQKSPDQVIQQVVIMDKFGNVLTQQKYPQNSKRVTLNVNGLSSDMYVARIFNGKKWTFLKFLKK